MHIELGIKDSHYVLSTLLNDLKKNQRAEQFYPFNYLYNPDYIPESDVNKLFYLLSFIQQPRTPVLISRNSSSITLKMIPFNPKVDEWNLLENKNLKVIKEMAMYGKVSAYGVNGLVYSIIILNIQFLKLQKIYRTQGLKSNQHQLSQLKIYQPMNNIALHVVLIMEMMSSLDQQV